MKANGKLMFIRVILQISYDMTRIQNIIFFGCGNHKIKNYCSVWWPHKNNQTSIGTGPDKLFIVINMRRNPCDELKKRIKHINHSNSNSKILSIE